MAAVVSTVPAVSGFVLEAVSGERRWISFGDSVVDLLDGEDLALPVFLA